MYQAFYKLTGKPFRLSPDPAFFFPSRGHKRALAYLRYGLNQDEGFVVITGAPGTGKTTLAKILLQEMDAGVVVAHLTTTQLEADDMLRMVAASFGLRYEGLDKAGLLKSLENFLLARSRERKRALLVIDEAQNLPARSLEELRMLSNLQIGDKALLQIFLLGQEQFRNMLDNPSLEQLRQRVIANYHLTPLAADECKRYIESRLQHVGWTNDPQFAEVAHELIHRYTDGIPRRINMLCDRIMLYGCMEEAHDITGEVVNLVKTEMDEEISGKNPDQLAADYDSTDEEQSATGYDSGQQSPRPPQAAAQKPAQPTKYELLKQKTDESEKLGIMATSFDNAGVEDDMEELDIDYALFEEKEPTITNSETKPDVKEVKEVKENRVEEASAQYSSAKKQEKPANKAAQAESQKPPVPKPEQQSTSNKQVMGNTVQKTKPETVKSEDGDGAKHSEISERDLFRVIPGGKSFGKIPGLGDSAQPGIAASAQSEPSSSDVKLRRILRLVLAFHRSPSRFPGLDSPLQPLPEGITELLELAISDDQVLNQVSPAAVMGISPVMLRAAVRFFVRRALFTPEGDHYRCLGLQPGATHTQIEKHYDLLMRLLRQDKQRGSADSVERVGQAYEALSRGERGPSAKSSAPKDTRAVFDDEFTIGENDTDSPDMMIDFEEVEKNPPRPAPSTFVAKPNERFNPVTNSGMSRKTVRYASQLAVLGFGALVIILGLYIVQLEPGSNAANQPKSPPSQKDNIGKEVAAITDKPSSQSLNSAAVETDNSDQTNDTKATFADPDQSEVDQVEAMRRELLANRGNDESDTNYEGPLNSTLDANSEQDSEQVSAAGKSARAPGADGKNSGELPPSRSSADETPSVSSTPPKPSQNPSTPQTATAESQAPQATSQQRALAANQFEGRDIEITENEPRRSETFSSIAARTPTPKVEAPATPPQSAATEVKVQPATTPQAPSQMASVVEPTPLQDAKQQTAANINEDELLNLVDNFIASYEAGNVDKVMSLFAGDARTNNRTNAKEIQSDYVELFKSTTARKMSITGMNWNVENDFARGVGDYRAQINPVDAQSSQTFSGNITIQVQKAPSGLKITRFYFSNQNVSTGPRLPDNASPAPAQNAVATATPAPTPAVANKSQAKPATSPITAQDLQSLVNKFAQSYASGNIESMMALFADNAKTNDQNTTAGIRKDYLDLFQGTDTRQMIIKNMKWSLANNQATGEGPFEVNVRAKGKKAVTSVKGSLKITVMKSNSGAKIVQMIHNVQ